MTCHKDILGTIIQLGDIVCHSSSRGRSRAASVEVGVVIKVSPMSVRVAHENGHRSVETINRPHNRVMVLPNALHPFGDSRISQELHDLANEIKGKIK